MRPAQSRTWSVGSRFIVNRWAECIGGRDPLVFTITRRTAKSIFFRAFAFDKPTDKDRRCARPRFYRDVARRLLVRVP